MSKQKSASSPDDDDAKTLTGDSGVADYIKRFHLHQQTDEERRKAEREDITVRGYRMPGAGFSRK